MLIKQKLQQGKQVCVAWNQSGSNYISEIFARANFDGVIIDLEHGPFGLETTIQHCQALQCSDTTPMARSTDGHKSTIKRILDTGVYGLLIPHISNVEEAKQAIAATKYPPEGIRGVAGSHRAAGFTHESLHYFERANEDIFVALAIETTEGYEALDDILQLDGYDAIFIGPADLSSSMGYLNNPSAQEVQNIITSIETKVLSSKKYLGTVANNDEQIIQKFSKGYHYLILMSDIGYISREAHRLIKTYGNG